ncbi:RagB/SusD family nutrient uptake outer membrane protein [Pedobacter sp. UC225_61]|uniref:RagB/SusD family nutrient uptake outer membrane protein n=1 Tax=Pedobacter sp. UC225_61 TaxID=3374623 RepID=UPI0037A89606
MKLKDNIFNCRTPKSTYWGLILLLVLATSSCEKFVDIKKNSRQAIIETAADCQLLLDNYSYMNMNYPSDGETSADDYFLYNAGYVSGSLTQAEKDFHIWASSAIRPGAAQWQPSYKTVFSANLVLETLAKIKLGTTDQVTLNTLRGSALFYRAFAFWQIAQLYAKPYIASTASQDLGIPIRLSSDINDESERGTVAQTYARITQDLQEAITLLPNTSSVASRPNKVAAYAMLARTYLSMEDYPNALINANAALQINNQLIDFNTLDKNAETPFSPRYNKEVIFQAVMAASTTPSTNILNPANDFTGAKINQALVDSYTANDLRKKIFLKPNTTDVQIPNQAPATGTTNVNVPDGTYRFTGNYEPAASALLFVGLAVDELYLIRAECYARVNNIAGAITDLNTLLRTRWMTGTYVDMIASSADDALVKVLTERRKELLMRNLRWSDLRRLNKDPKFQVTLTRQIKEYAPVITGYYSGNPSTYTVTNGYTVKASYTLPPNDLRYTLLIPQQVINNSSVPQNPR